MRSIDYSRITLIQLDTNCTLINSTHWDKLMKGAVRADKKEVNRLVKRDLPDLHYSLGLEFYNPYNYFRTDRHIILVHSSIEYFISYQSK